MPHDFLKSLRTGRWPKPIQTSLPRVHLGLQNTKFGSMWRRRITPLHFFELQNTVFVAIFEQIRWSSSKKSSYEKSEVKKNTSLLATEWRCAKFPSRFATFVALIGTFCHGVKLFLKFHVLNMFLVVSNSLWPIYQQKCVEN